MKKRITILLALCLLTALVAAGCSAKPEDEPPQAPETSEEPVRESSGTEPDASLPSLSLESMDISIGGAELLTIDGEEALCVYFDFTNTSEIIIQPSNFVSFDVLLGGESLSFTYGDTDEQEIYAENFHRRIFPGAALRCGLYFLMPKSEGELVIVATDLNSYDEEELRLDLSALPPLAAPPVSSPALNIKEMAGFLGTQGEIHDEKYDLWPGGALKLSGHEFIERDGESFVILFFYLLVTSNLEEGEGETPSMMLNYFCYQDGVQLGLSTTVDDRYMISDLFELYPDLAKPSEEVGLGEAITFPAVYRLNSDSDLDVTATFFGISLEDGVFIGDTIPVK